MNVELLIADCCWLPMQRAGGCMGIAPNWELGSEPSGVTFELSRCGKQIDCARMKARAAPL